MNKLFYILSLLLLSSISVFGTAFSSAPASVGSGNSSPTTIAFPTSSNGQNYVLFFHSIGTPGPIQSGNITVSAGAATFHRYSNTSCGANTHIEVFVARNITGGTTPTITVPWTGTGTVVLTGAIVTSINATGGGICRTGTGTTVVDTVLQFITSSSLLVYGVTGSGNATQTATNSPTQGTLGLTGLNGGNTISGGMFYNTNNNNFSATLSGSENWAFYGLALEQTNSAQTDGVRFINGYYCGSTGAPPSTGIYCPMPGVTAASALGFTGMISSGSDITYTVSDNISGGNWSAGRHSSAGGTYVTDIQYLLNSAGGDVIVQIVPSSLTGNPAYFLAEFTGTKTSSALDTITGAVGTAPGNQPSTGNLNTNFANEILFGLCRSANNLTVTSGTRINGASPTGRTVFDSIVTSAPGPYTFAGTISSGAWDCSIIGLIDANQPTSTVPIRRIIRME